jgi:hypothetical protein
MVVLEGDAAIEFHRLLYNANQTLKLLVKDGVTGCWVLDGGKISVGGGEHISLVEGTLKTVKKLDKLLDVTTLPMFVVNGDLLFQSHKEHKHKILKLTISEGSLTVVGTTKDDEEHESCHTIPARTVNSLVASIQTEKEFVAKTITEDPIEYEFDENEFYELLGSKDLPEIVVAEDDLCLIEDLEDKSTAVLMIRIPQKASLGVSTANKGALTELGISILKNDMLSVKFTFENKFFDADQYFRVVNYVI